MSFLIDLTRAVQKMHLFLPPDLTMINCCAKITPLDCPSRVAGKKGR